MGPLILSLEIRPRGILPERGIRVKRAAHERTRLTSTQNHRTIVIGCPSLTKPLISIIQLYHDRFGYGEVVQLEKKELHLRP
jgi:hypothetical protein